MQWEVPDPQITNPATGTFVLVYQPTMGRIHRCRVEGTGTCQAASESAFDIEESVVL